MLFIDTADAFQAVVGHHVFAYQDTGARQGDETFAEVCTDKFSQLCQRPARKRIVPAQSRHLDALGRPDAGTSAVEDAAHALRDVVSSLRLAQCARLDPATNFREQRQKVTHIITCRA